jgi:hypothetical protein
VPLLIILGASFIHELLSRWDRRGAIAAIAVLLAAVPALSMSDVDPRNVVPPIVAASGARAVFDRYSDYQLSRTILGLVSRPTKDVADIVVTSNLAYDRFDFSVPRKGSNSAKRAAYYRDFPRGPILTCRMGGRPWRISIRWCGSLPWTDRWRGLRRSPRTFVPPPRA